ncbi:MAG: hypothetical protein ACOY3D_05855, partial [Candidatus Omnitrophota bacterium]
MDADGHNPNKSLSEKLAAVDTGPLLKLFMQVDDSLAGEKLEAANSKFLKLTSQLSSQLQQILSPEEFDQSGLWKALVALDGVPGILPLMQGHLQGLSVTGKNLHAQAGENGDIPESVRHKAEEINLLINYLLEGLTSDNHRSNFDISGRLNQIIASFNRAEEMKIALLLPKKPPILVNGDQTALVLLTMILRERLRNNYKNGSKDVNIEVKPAQIQMFDRDSGSLRSDWQIELVNDNDFIAEDILERLNTPTRRVHERSAGKKDWLLDNSNFGSWMIWHFLGILHGTVHYKNVVAVNMRKVKVTITVPQELPAVPLDAQILQLIIHAIAHDISNIIASMQSAVREHPAGERVIAGYMPAFQTDLMGLGRLNAKLATIAQAGQASSPISQKELNQFVQVGKLAASVREKLAKPEVNFGAIEQIAEQMEDIAIENVAFSPQLRQAIDEIALLASYGKNLVERKVGQNLTAELPKRAEKHERRIIKTYVDDISKAAQRIEAEVAKATSASSSPSRQGTASESPAQRQQPMSVPVTAPVTVPAPVSSPTGTIPQGGLLRHIQDLFLPQVVMAPSSPATEGIASMDKIAAAGSIGVSVGARSPGVEWINGSSSAVVDRGTGESMSPSIELRTRTERSRSTNSFGLATNSGSSSPISKEKAQVPEVYAARNAGNSGSIGAYSGTGNEAANGKRNAGNGLGRFIDVTKELAVKALLDAALNDSPLEINAGISAAQSVTTKEAEFLEIPTENSAVGVFVSSLNASSSAKASEDKDSRRFTVKIPPASA